jgi:hypothetical protein
VPARIKVCRHPAGVSSSNNIRPMEATANTFDMLGKLAEPGLERARLSRAIKRGDAAWEAKMVAAMHLLERTLLPRTPSDLVAADLWEARHRVVHFASVSAARLGGCSSGGACTTTPSATAKFGSCGARNPRHVCALSTPSISIWCRLCSRATSERRRGSWISISLGDIARQLRWRAARSVS